MQQPPLCQVLTTYGPLAVQADPISLEEALTSSDSTAWWKACCEEISAIIKNNTWVLSKLPPGKKVIPLKWVFKIKRDAKGQFEKYKARIVIKGFSQIAGLDFNETFAPVIQIHSIRVLFALAVVKDLYILHVALNSKSDIEIYVS